MMRRLLSESEDSMKAHVGRVCSDAVAQHVQPLKAEIATERTERAQFQKEVKEDIAALHKRQDELEQSLKTRPSVRASASDGKRTNEIVIGGFHRKSKAGAIAMVRQIIAGCAGNPQIIEDRVAKVPQLFLSNSNRMHLLRHL